MAKQPKKPTEKKPRNVFHVQCLGHEWTGLIYQETNDRGEQRWTFRVDHDGYVGAAKFS
jgi:hypothetical protein